MPTCACTTVPCTPRASSPLSPAPIAFVSEGRPTAVTWTASLRSVQTPSRILGTAVQLVRMVGNNQMKWSTQLVMTSVLHADKVALTFSGNQCSLSHTHAHTHVPPFLLGAHPGRQIFTINKPYIYSLTNTNNVDAPFTHTRHPCNLAHTQKRNVQSFDTKHYSTHTPTRSASAERYVSRRKRNTTRAHASSKGFSLQHSPRVALQWTLATAGRRT